MSFSDDGAEPWLPLGDTEAFNVADQRADPDSALNLCRDLIALRRRDVDPRRGAYRRLEAPEGAWAFRRGERIIVALNLSDRELEIPDVQGRLEIGTDRGRDGETVGGSLRLEPWQAAVVRADGQ